jgi:voltage-dependent potassium channel beta subunit
MSSSSSSSSSAAGAPAPAPSPAPAPAIPLTTLGRTGLIVPRLSFGSWVTFHYQVDADAAYELMAEAYKSGIFFFDNAEAYASGQSETVQGIAIQRGIKEGLWTREDLVLTTKIFFGTKSGPNAKGLSRKHLIEGTKASLARMQVDYVDVLFAHRPDPVTPIEEIVRAMHHIIETKGWAFYWGTSEWSAAQITEAVQIADRLGLHKPVVEQPEYNIFQRQKVEFDFAPLIRNHGLGFTTWSPLATGVLTGKYSGRKAPEGSRLTLPNYDFLVKSKFGDDAWQVDAADALKPIADGLGCTLAQLSIAWCLKNDDVSNVILGATSVSQLRENLGCLSVLPKLTGEVMARIDEVVDGIAKASGVPKPVSAKPALNKIETQVAGVRGIASLTGAFARQS